MRKKKIWLIMCEGKTDKLFLDTYHDESLEDSIVIHIYSGDFIMDYNNSITEQNVISKLKEKFESLIRTIINSYHLKTNDIARVIYMTDTDNCIVLENLKWRLLKRIITVNHLKINNKEIKFNLLLMANDLEHVLIGRDALVEGKICPDEKESIVLDFTDEFDSKDKIDSKFLKENR